MLNPSKLLILSERFLNKCICRNYSVKRKYPVNRHLEDELPIERYERRVEGQTSVHVWGLAEHGALGVYLQKRMKMRKRTDQRFLQFNRPVRLTFGEINHVTDIAAGFGFSLLSVRTTTGDRVFGTGLNTDSQLGYHDPRRNAPLGVLISPVPISLPSDNKKCKIISISAGRAHSAIVTDKMGVFTFGNNAFGQCGRRIITDENYSGNRIVNNIKDCHGNEIVQAVCGMDHTIFLTNDGKVFSCGWGADGQTGLGHFNSEGQPSWVQGDIKDEKIIKVSTKADCCLALNEKGEVFGWGNSEYSQLLSKDDSRQQINVPLFLKKCSGFGKIIDIAVGGCSCLILNENGEVFSWGYGILGQGPEVNQSLNPQLIPPILFGKNEFRPDSFVTSINSGVSFNAAISNYGDIYTWGKNTKSCLGLGNDDDQFFPLRVAVGLRVTKASLGLDHVVSLTKS